MQFIENLGYAVINFFAERLPNMGAALEIAGVGMLGIFVVMGIIILAITLLGKLFTKK